MSLFAELKRRHVYRVAIAYAVTAWLLLQLASILFPAFGAPSWAIRLLFGFLLFGLLVAILLAWAFEVTPAGVRRTESADSEAARSEATGRRVGRRLDFAIIAILVAAVGVLAWRLSMQSAAVSSHPAIAASASAAPSRQAVAPATAIPAKSIAVLPFENLSTDKANDYFVTGMQVLILTKLADIGDLKVISRTSTLQYASHPDNLETIARQLGVATILEGSVQKADNQVLINVRLIDARTDAQIWAEAYPRTLDNVFGVEGEVAEKVAVALQAKLSPAETQRLATALSPDTTANDLFLRAEYFANRGQINYDTAAFRQAIPLYQQAIVRIPHFALARARLSYAESAVAWFGGGGDTRQLNAEAHAQAELALALQPGLAEAHLALGYSDYWGRGDYAGALTAFAAALKERPNDAATLKAMGYVLRRQGNFDAAIGALQQALTLDPRNTGLASELASTYMMASHYAEAERLLRRALALDPDNIQAKLNYSTAILYGSGDVTRALTEAQGNDPQLQLQRVTLLTYQRKYREALALMAGVPDTPNNFSYIEGPKTLQLANLYRLAGDITHAQALYAQALPQVRVGLAAQAGNAIQLSFVWGNIAAAELGLGRTDAALTAITRSQTLVTQSNDHVYGPSQAESNAELYAQAGRADLAVPLLEKAFATPGIGNYYSPMMLWLDPAWDPIRKNPNFQALLKKYAQYRPASAATTAPAAATAATS